jgi:hypothetical protein
MDAAAASGETLLVLAGPKGAGKTTLLTNALSAKAPLFGPAADAVFQATQLPGAGKEFRMPTEQVLERRTWASDPHLVDIANRASPLPHLVVHLDLMDFCRFSARPFESILNAEANLMAMQRNPGAVVFERYRAAHLATLGTSYELCAVWYKSRAVEWGKSLSANDERLYSGTAEGRAAFSAIHEAWLRFAAALRNVAAHWHVGYDGETVTVSAA